jgi:hypothetical protein
MGRVKEHYLETISHQSIDEDYYNEHINHMDYDAWVSSEDYIDYVNAFAENMKPIYSKSDLMSAIEYGISAVQVTEYEVGSDVYGKLLKENTLEYLDSINYFK